MIKFYFLDIDDTWSAELPLQKILEKILAGEIERDTLLWSKRYCPGDAMSPIECIHDDAFVEAGSVTDFASVVFNLNADNFIKSEDFATYLKYNQKTNINAEMAAIIIDRGKEFLDEIVRLGVNKYEAYLISKYADRNASVINPQLRKNERGSIPKKIFIEEDLLNSALSALDGYSSSVVYGMYSTSDEEIILPWFANRITEYVKFPNFLSTSTSKWTSAKYIYFKVSTAVVSRGKHIAKLTNKAQLEDEILFMSGCVFKIIGVDVDKKLITLIEQDSESSSCVTTLTNLYYLNNRKPNEPKIE